jgi:prepilin-type N-terminal cleavage/methylation domain-containing protein
MSRRAFTLMELLVVVTVIAILTAFIIPVASLVREMAREVECRSSMRQVTLGVLGYTQDNRGCLPLMQHYNSSPPAGQPGWTYWPDFIATYVDARGFTDNRTRTTVYQSVIGKCPNAKRDVHWIQNATQAGTYGLSEVTWPTYSYNDFPESAWADSGVKAPQLGWTPADISSSGRYWATSYALARVPNVSVRAMFTEGDSIASSNYACGDKWINPVHTRHRGKNSYALFDGRVKMLNPAHQITVPGWATTSNIHEVLWIYFKPSDMSLVQAQVEEKL